MCSRPPGFGLIMTFTTVLGIFLFTQDYLFDYLLHYIITYIRMHLSLPTHPIFVLVFQSRTIMVLPFGVLASEFSIEAKNINRFAGECREFFSKNFKGGTKGNENSQ